MIQTKQEDLAWKNYINQTIEEFENNQTTIPQPSNIVHGGPFAGSVLDGQKILGNKTFYFAYRDENGNELSQTLNQSEATNNILLEE